MAGRLSSFWIENSPRLLEMKEQGMSWPEIARALGVSAAAARMKFGELEAGPPNGGELPAPVMGLRTPRPRLSQVVDIDPAPFAVPIAKAIKPTPGKPLTAVVFGDSQVPFQDDRCLAVVEGIIAQAKPDILLHMGDLIDAFQISDYDRDPNRLSGLQEDIDAARMRLHRWAQLAPKARRVLLEGNHEERLRRIIWRLPDTAKELARLRAFQEAMTWPRLLELDGIGWEFIPTSQQSRTEVLPRLITVHGHQVSNGGTVSGAMARKVVAKYGRSAVAGHIHRACVLMNRDHNGQAFGIETGCTCLLDGQPYGIDFNWQQAVTVIEWSGDRHVMNVQQVIVRDGRALFQGKDYRSAA